MSGIRRSGFAILIIDDLNGSNKKMARKNEHVQWKYDDKAMELGVKFYRQSEIPLDLLYHLMRSHRLNSFSAILLHSDRVNFGEFLNKHKRKTDLLYELDGQENIYALFCQETQVDGGFYFIKRLQTLMENEGADDITAAIVGVESTVYPVKDLMFIILDTFIRARSKEEPESVIFKTVK